MSVGSSDISFSGLQSAYAGTSLTNAADNSGLNSGTTNTSMADFRGATFTDGNSVPASGEISISAHMRGKTFGSSATTLTIKATYVGSESPSGVSFFVDSNSATSVPLSTEGYTFSSSQTTTTSDAKITVVHPDFLSAPLVIALYYDSEESDYLEIESGIGEFTLDELEETPTSTGNISSSNLGSHTNIFLLIEFAEGGGDDY